VVITIVKEELDAVKQEFGLLEEVSGYGCWVEAVDQDATYPVLLTQSRDRSNLPCQETVTAMLEDWQPEYLVLVGIAGGITKLEHGELSGPAPGDVVCAEYVHYGEYTKRVEGRRLCRYIPVAQPRADDLARVAKPIAQLKWHESLTTTRPVDGVPNLHFGEIVAVEFLAGDGGAAEQREIFNEYDHALAVDMESFGAARAMHNTGGGVHYGPTWFSVRGISDRAAATPEVQAMLGVNDDERKAWRNYAAASAACFARVLVERLLNAARPPHLNDPGAPAWRRAAARSSS
jgi:nucleoside phosphorylase